MLKSLRRNQVLRLNNTLDIGGHRVRTVRRLHNDVIKVEVVRESVRGGGQITCRWRPLSQLGINPLDLKQAIEANSKAQAQTQEFAAIF